MRQEVLLQNILTLDLKTPSFCTWARVCGLLEQALPAEQERLAKQVARSLVDWPVHLCRPLYSWWKALQRGESIPFGPIIKDDSMWAWTPGAASGEKREMPGLPDANVIWCAPGTFQMGASPIPTVKEAPEQVTLVTLDQGFWMWETPMTEGQFLELAGFVPNALRKRKEALGFIEKRPSSSLDYPATELNWFHALATCDLLSSFYGLPTQFGCPIPTAYASLHAALGDVSDDPEEVKHVRKRFCEDEGRAYYRCKGFRLPTEAEWEYACRADSVESRYGALDEIAWHYNNSLIITKRVKLKKPNNWGFHDMLGNSSEWCWDKHVVYPGGEVHNFVGAEQDEIVAEFETLDDLPAQLTSYDPVIRGAGRTVPEFLYASYRSFHVGAYASCGISFRPVLSLPGCVSCLGESAKVPRG